MRKRKKKHSFNSILKNIIYENRISRAEEYAHKQEVKKEINIIKYGDSGKPSRKKIKYSKILIPIIILAIVGYTVANFILQSNGFGEMSPTLTTCYFGFFGIDLITLCGIKITDTVKERNIKPIINDSNEAVG